MRKTYKNKWLEFTPGWHWFDLRFCLASCFDEWPMIVVCLGWGVLFIKLPFRTGIYQCKVPNYGVYYFDKSLWFCWGMKLYSFYMPYKWDWVRTSLLLKNGDWEHETRSHILDYYTEEYRKKLWLENYNYTYILKDGTEQRRIATVGVEEREWRWHWFKWFPYIRKIEKVIDVSFNEGIGEETGSWKGDCMGCGYEMLPGETPYDTLSRMERERKF